ncbi:hypothetical protein J056_002324 [Wallemia ichthyophaga EXF-994]|uniref:Bud22 domain-containing protein n=1 Tax=Wallemia ichthyophaga (strain EXF-994 / CBS 113033) TaxID=1299270 RepID=R9AAV8_WALI9|nr:uncharacterized protein J056_002324 [Wallemia ichthyophaga EXF-994]EOQ99199.1 hypothetical protein J056_002324 [Wallemia ichthyophaga EXF-994]
MWERNKHSELLEQKRTSILLDMPDLKTRTSLAVAIEKYKERLHGDSTSNMHLRWANLQTRMNVGAVEKVKFFIQMQQQHEQEQARDNSSSHKQQKKQKVEKPAETAESRTEKLHKKLHHILHVDLRRAVKDARVSEHKRLQKKLTQLEKMSSKGEKVDSQQQEEAQNQLIETKEYDGLPAAQHTFFSKLSKHNQGAFKSREEVIHALNKLSFNWPAISLPSNAPQGKVAARFMSIEQISSVAKSAVDSVVSILGDGAKKENEVNVQAEQVPADDKQIKNDKTLQPPTQIKKERPATDNSALIAKLTNSLGGTVRDDDDEEEEDQEADSDAPLSGYTSGEASDDALQNWPDPDADSDGDDDNDDINNDDINNDDDDADNGNALLNSLNTGVGYISGGSDDISDAEEKVAPRKNRMGQRARRMIHEKKFGRGANHVQKKFEEDKQLERAKRMGRNKLDSGWKGRQQRQSEDQKPNKDLNGGYKKDFKKDNKTDSNHSSKHDRGYKNHSKPHSKPSVPIKPGTDAAADDQGQLHPSWAAKKAQAEAIANAPAPTKITFD